MELERQENVLVIGHQVRSFIYILYEAYLTCVDSVPCFFRRFCVVCKCCTSRQNYAVCALCWRNVLIISLFIFFWGCSYRYAYFHYLPQVDLPYIKVPLHTVIKLTPKAYGCDEERFVLFFIGGR